MIVTKVRGAILRDPVAATFDPAHPWDYTVDYCIPGTNTRDTSIDSYDYGRVATHAEAVAAVCQAIDRFQIIGEVGAHYTFHALASGDSLHEHDGEDVVVIRQLDESEADREVGRMFEVRNNTGERFQVFEAELSR